MRPILCITLFLTGCATVDARLPSLDSLNIDEERTYQGREALNEINRLRDRLSRVAAPILRNNADICQETRAVTGLVTQKLENYPDSLKQVAAEEFGIKDDPTIIYVRPYSPAQSIGLLPGDQIRGTDGEFYQHTDKAFERNLLSQEPVNIYRNGDLLKTIKIPYETHCDFDLKLKMSSAINAYATGKSLIMTSGMMAFTQTDDELAYILGHELAHNTEGHIRKSITNYVITLGKTSYTRPFEAEADYVGLYYAARAGYRLDGVENMWRRLATISTKPIYKAKTHPTYPDRYVLIKATRNEIRAKKAAGEPLMPNSKSGNE